ncbi:MAG: hypothetical protein ACLVJK_07555 [Alistipes putredinis]
MIRLSLIIATYNPFRSARRSARSVVRQDFPAAEWESIVVNNEFAGRHARPVPKRSQQNIPQSTCGS